MATADITDDVPTARLKALYLEEIRPALIERFGYSSVMQAPKIEKITLNMGVGMARQDNKMLKAASDQLATIAGQRPSVRRARKSIAAFKLREGMPVGVSVTLRGARGYEFLDRLVSIAIPRIRDFRGLNPRSFDGRGNYSMGVREQIIFPEVDYDAIDQVRGMDITITTTAGTDAEAFALLSALGMPFAQQGRPAGFETPGDGGAQEQEAPAAEEAQSVEERPPAEAQAAEEIADEGVAEEVAAEAMAADAAEALAAEEVADELAQEAAIEDEAGELADEVIAEATAADADAETPVEEAEEVTAEAAGEAPQAEATDSDDDTAEKESTD